MPIYEYECEECHQVTEISQSIADDPLSTCPTCSGHVKKLISRSSFHLKGGGWYADGYSNSKPCAEADKCAASTAKPDTKSDSKPATCPKKSEGAPCCAA